MYIAKILQGKELVFSEYSYFSSNSAQPAIILLIATNLYVCSFFQGISRKSVEKWCLVHSPAIQVLLVW